MITFLRALLGWPIPPTEVVITDRRPFTDDDMWKPFPFQDGDVLSEW